MSQEGIIDIIGTYPMIPIEFDADVGFAIPIANVLNIVGDTQVAGTTPIHTEGAGNTISVVAQLSQAIAATDATKVGMSVFNSGQFSVDANGFVSLLGGTEAIDSIAVQTGTSPIVPTVGGLVTINGAVVAAGTNPVRSDGTGANTLAIEVQTSQAIAAADATKIGLSNYSSTDFGVTAAGFVTLSTTGAGKTITGQSGGALSPIANNWNIYGSTVVAGTTPVSTSGSGNTLTTNVQISQAIASTDVTKIGLSNFNSAHFSVDANGFVSLTGGGQAIDSFTTDVSGPVSPDAAGNVAFTGATNIFSDGSVANTMRLNLQGTNHALYVGRGTNTASANLGVGTDGQALLAATGADPAFATVGFNANMNTVTGANSLTLNPYNCSKWIVDPTANIGTHTTIAAAIAAASSGDTIFIRPATYTENLTLKAGVDLTAFGCDSSINATGHVIINGTSTLTTAGTVDIYGIQLQTNGAAFLSVTGSAASVVNLNNCYLNCINATGIIYSSSSTGSGIYIKDSTGNLGTTGIAFITATGAGTSVGSSEGVFIKNSKFTNSGGSTTANTTSACVMRLQHSQFENPFTTSSTGAVAIQHSLIYCGGINVTAITTAGTALNTTFYSVIYGGTQPAISIGAGTTMIVCQNDINSSNTNAITGAGTISYAGNTFDSSSNINVTTQNLIAEGPSSLISSSNSGNTNTLTVSNTSNTASSSANILSAVGGSTAADPTHQARVTGVTTWTWGIDNSVTTPTADPFVIAQGTALGTNNVMSVATSGEINYPLQPSFYAYQPSQASNVTGDGTTYTLGSTVDLTEVFDQNGDFDPTTGILTAPVTGKYQLNGRASIVGGTAITSYSNSIVTSNRSHGLRVDFGAAAVLQNFDLSNSALCDMDAADTATFVVGTTDSGGKIDDVFGDASSGFTSFSGFLQA